MTFMGWCVMIASVMGTTAFFLWCMSRVLRGDAQKKVHGFEFETPDEKQDHHERRRPDTAPDREN